MKWKNIVKDLAEAQSDFLKWYYKNLKKDTFNPIEYLKESKKKRAADGTQG